MYYFTLNPNEMKREIKKFDEKIVYNVNNKSIRKFSFEMLYGIGASGSCRLADIARTLKESTKTAYVVDRLSDNLLRINEDEEKIIWNNYRGIVNEYTGKYHETVNSGIITEIEGKRTLKEINHMPAIKQYAEWTGFKTRNLMGDKILTASILKPLGVKTPTGNVTLIRHPMTGNSDYSINVGNCFLQINVTVY